MAVYGHVSLVSDFKLTRENDDLLSSRHKFLRYRTLSLLKCGFPTEDTKLTRFVIFEIPGVRQLGTSV